MKFKGDIIITDPCYIIKERTGKPCLDDYPILKGKYAKPFKTFTDEENKVYAQYQEDKKQWEIDNSDDWEKCEYGENMEALGFTNYITSDTGVGDWSCTTYSSTIEKDIDIILPMGEFCADAGMVGVFLLDEVLKYNPKFDYHIEKPHTTTFIKDFDGDIDICSTTCICKDEDTNENVEVEEVRVVGKGNINFFTTQTGF